MQFVNYEYKLDEIIEEMEKSINNIIAIVNHQKEVAESLNKDDKEKFKDFVQGLENSTKQYEEQKRVIEYRKVCLMAVKDMLSQAPYVSEKKLFISLLFEGLGVVNQDAKTLEKRKENKEEVEEISL